MSDDSVYIAPDAVSSVGAELAVIAAAALLRTASFFTSSPEAAAANPGFTVGAPLTAFATELHQIMDGFINDLSTNAEQIVNGAATMKGIDQTNIDGFDRELATLNGLGKNPLPGR
jgi:hypothetical protein